MKKVDSRFPSKSAGMSGSEGAESKFELLSCKRDGVSCQNHLLYINKSYIKSDRYYQNKEYFKSVEALDKAFKTTFKLDNSTCKKCAEMFRSTIIRSLEEIHTELHGMSSGLFRKKQYKSSYIMAGNVLQSLKQEVSQR